MYEDFVCLQKKIVRAKKNVGKIWLFSGNGYIFTSYVGM